MPKRIFVTRHPGAVAWAERQGLPKPIKVVESFDPATLRPGDVVMGTLPVHLVAEVNRRGGHYWHLTMETPPELRGTEMSADQMQACNARLSEFRVLDLGPRTEAMAGPDAWDDAPDRPALHLCIATGQQLPNAISILQCQWDRVVIFASQSMKKSAEKLAALVADEAHNRGLAEACAEPLRFSLPEQDDVRAVRETVQAAVAKLRKTFPEHQLVLNISGGKKLMTLGFADALRAQAKVLYCDADRGVLESVEPEGEPALELGRVLDFATYLRVQGLSIVRGGAVSAARLQSALARRRLTATLALCLPSLSKPLLAKADIEKKRGKWAEKDCAGFASLIHTLAHAAQESQRELGRVVLKQSARLLKGSFIGPEGMALWQHLVAAGLLVAEGSQVDDQGEVTIQFAHIAAAQYLAGGYMEEFALLSAQQVGLPLSHLGLNTTVDVLQPLANRKSREMNEIDVALVWKSRVLLIECKAGRALDRGEKAQDILNKASTVRASIGGAKASSWVVSNTSLAAASAADVLERAQLTNVQVTAGRAEMEGLPQRIANWAGVPLPASVPNWADAVLPLQPAP